MRGLLPERPGVPERLAWHAINGGDGDHDLAQTAEKPSVLKVDRNRNTVARSYTAVCLAALHRMLEESERK